MSVRYTHGPVVSTEKRTFDFDIIDERGRTIGYVASVFEVEAREVNAADEFHSWAPRINAAGLWYIAYVQATRNGERYGAVQSYSYHRTLDDAWAAASKRADAMWKRYTKKYKGAA